MDAKSAQIVVPSEPLKYQTWFLKVSIHCEGCRRKVKKVLQSIDGVFTTTIDPQQQKVTVTGSVGVEKLIRKLVKAGKRAEIWPENVASSGKGKNSGKEKRPHQKKDEQGEAKSKENLSTTTNAGPNSSKSNKKKGIVKSDENGKVESKSTGISGGGERDAPAPEQKGGESEGGSGKKKKKKGESENESGGGAGCGGVRAHTGLEGQMNLSPTRQLGYLYPETYCYPPVVYLTTHNMLCPMGTMGGPSYYVSQCIDHDPYYRIRSTPLAPFEIFSDENANACSIM